MNPVKDGDAEAEEDEEALNSLSDEDKLARSHFNHQVLLRAVPAVLCSHMLRSSTTYNRLRYRWLLYVG